MVFYVYLHTLKFLKHTKIGHSHCAKSVSIRSYSRSYFPAFGLNTNQNNSEYGHFSLSALLKEKSITTGVIISFDPDVKKVFLEISQNWQESTSTRVSFWIKLHVEACNFLKKRLWYSCFPVNFVKFLRTPFFIGHLRWLRLYMLLYHYALVEIRSLNLLYHYALVEIRSLNLT